MDLTIVVLSYNHPDLTTRAVTSALHFLEVPIVLVHNGSEIRHVQTLQQRFPHIQHVILSKNRGWAGGTNAGLDEAFQKSGWAILLTNDTEMMSLPQLPQNPQLVAPCIELRKTGRVDSLGGAFDPARARLVHYQNVQEFQQGKLRPYIPGAAFLIHRDLFNQVGGFDEKLGTYWEDVDFSQRVRANGFPLSVDSQWHIQHQVGKTCRPLAEYSLYYFQRNRKRVSFRYCSRLQRPRLWLLLHLSWANLALRLMRQGRHRDLRWLFKAAWD